MTTKRYPFKRRDGTVTIIIPAKNPRPGIETDALWNKRSVDKIRIEVEREYGPIEPMKECDASTLPDREFRNAWRANDDGTLRVDAVEKAKIIAARTRLDPNPET